MHCLGPDLRRHRLRHRRRAPPGVEVGDWLYFSDMGAYTSCAGSNFNGMELPDVAYLQGHAPSRPQPPETAAADMLRKLAAEGFAP